MKQFKLFTILFFTFFSTLCAYDLSGIQDLNNTCQINRTTEIPIPKKTKTSETKYEKLERKLSEYRGTWFKDMMVYSADMFIPDEMVRAVKDVMANRQEKGFSDQTARVSQTLANDSYNTVLTTAFYYMQDMARMSERIWKDEACNPGHFDYDNSIEPKEPILDLSECDSIARGATENGVVLPLNVNFPNALYPYASKPDGCSAEGLQDLYDQSNDLLNADQWLKEACNIHDKCYYTEGTTAKECNSKFIVKIVDACNEIKAKETVQYLGMKNAICGMKGLFVATGANACAKRYFEHAQKKQKAYNQWVHRYEKAYKELEEQQKLQNKGQ